MDILKIIGDAYSGYAGYLWREITHPHWGNYFYWLIAVSLFFFAFERIHPWRDKQAVIRKDFWLDLFYMFFNFFLFSLIIYNAASDVIVTLFNNGIKSISGIDLQILNPMSSWPMWAILLVGFVVRDFVQWWTHRLLHRVPSLWEFHKVHHSVEEMGFAAHLRYHWMETVVYRTIEYIPLALLGIGLYDFFVIHIFTLAWGHYNHSNLSVKGQYTGAIVGGLLGVVVSQGLWDISAISDDTVVQILAIAVSATLGYFVLGPVMKYIFNSPEMHIWHHAKDMPDHHPYGINYGLTLSVWDYIFGQAFVPYEGKELNLGFPEINTFPKTFLEQFKYGFSKNNS